MLDPISQKSRFLSRELHKKLDNLPRMRSVGKASNFQSNVRVDTNP